MSELWVECSRCGLRMNVLQVDGPPGCGCEAHWYVLPELAKRPGPEPAADALKMVILQARLGLQHDLGREPSPAELARETDVSEEVLSLYRDETGAGGVPSWLLDRWVDHVDADPHVADPPDVVLVRALLRTALEVSDSYTDLVRFMARANAAPEAEMTRLKLLWTTWTDELTGALRRRGVGLRQAETAAKRAIIVLWDAVTRWGADNHRGHYGPFLRDALLAQIPEAIVVIDELTALLPQWQAPPTDLRVP